MRVTYALKEEKSVLGLARTVRNYLRNEEGMEVQVVKLESGICVIQGRVRYGAFRQVAGMDKKVTVKLSASGTEKADVEIGMGKWIDKGIVMLVSFFTFWPLCVSSAVGIYEQAKLPGRILKAAEEYLFPVGQDIS